MLVLLICLLFGYFGGAFFGASSLKDPRAEMRKLFISMGGNGTIWAVCLLFLIASYFIGEDQMQIYRMTTEK